MIRRYILADLTKNVATSGDESKHCKPVAPHKLASHLELVLEFSVYFVTFVRLTANFLVNL